MLTAEIAAFDKARSELEAEHMGEWVVFHSGAFTQAFSDFEGAASFVADSFPGEPCLIRQVGAGPVQLQGGMLFRPAHALDTSGL